MITELLQEKYLGQEIEIFLNGHVFFFPGNPYYNGKRELTTWELESCIEKTIFSENGSWSKFRTIKSKTVKVLEVIMKPDYEGTIWYLRCQGEKKEYLIEVPQ